MIPRHSKIVKLDLEVFAWRNDNNIMNFYLVLTTYILD
jgi:hypothetical protein